MQEIELAGLRVVLGTPRQVSEGVGHHWFPTMSRFPTGELLLTRSLSADSNENLMNQVSVSISRDSGETWEPPYDVPAFVGGCTPRVVQSDGSLLSIDNFFTPDPPGQWRRFCSHYLGFVDGGRYYVVEPRAVCIDGLPRDVAPSPYEGKWSRQWQAQINPWGDVVELDGGVLMLAYLKFQEDAKYSLVALNSTDRGRNWHYLSTVAGSDSVPGAKEGPDESSMLQLECGDLMCVMRVGGGKDQLLARTYSSNGGQTWSVPDRLPAYSVAPCLRRIENGALILSTGRPGIYLWLSTDPRGETWQEIDIVAHHNAEVTDPKHTITPERSGDREKRHLYDQTTAYTVMVEIAPNRLLQVYDRIPFGWNPVPTDSDERNRIYVLPIEVTRV